jgi:MFS family permease
MLPLMGGLIVAAKGSGPLAERFGGRAVIAAGLAVLSFAGFLGSRITVDSGYGFTALWLSVAGLGFGFSMVPAMTAAIDALPPDRAGSGSGLLTTVRQVGSAIGIALIGSLLAAVYESRLPPDAPEAAGDSVVAAHLLGDPALAAAADAAYVRGMGVVLLACGIAALVTALLAAALLPKPGRALAPVAPDVAGAGADARQ